MEKLAIFLLTFVVVSIIAVQGSNNQGDEYSVTRTRDEALERFRARKGSGSINYSANITKYQDVLRREAQMAASSGPIPQNREATTRRNDPAPPTVRGRGRPRKAPTAAYNPNNQEIHAISSDSESGPNPSIPKRQREDSAARQLSQYYRENSADSDFNYLTELARASDEPDPMFLNPVASQRTMPNNADSFNRPTDFVGTSNTGNERAPRNNNRHLLNQLAGKYKTSKNQKFNFS